MQSSAFPSSNGDPSSTGSPDPHASPHAPHRHKPHDNPMLSLFGVLVVWSSLVIIFTANRLSETYMRIDFAGASALTHKNPVYLSMDEQVKILLPFSTFIPRTTRAEALKAVGAYVNFNVMPDLLNQLDDKRQTFRCTDSPVYAVLHSLIDRTTLGFSLLNNNLTLFPQEFEINSPAPGKQEVKWKADLPLSSQRLIVVPSGQSRIWLALRLSGEPNEEVNRWNGIQVEVHKEASTLTVSRAVLDDKGSAQLSMTDSQTITLKIDRISTPGVKSAPRFHFTFFYQGSA